MAVTTVGEIKKLKPKEEVPAKGLSWLSTGDGRRVIQPVVNAAAIGALSVYVGSRQLSGGASSASASTGGANAGIPVSGGSTPLISTYNPAGAANVSMTAESAGGVPAVKTYTDPLVVVKNAGGEMVGQVGTAKVDSDLIGGKNRVRLETYDGVGQQDRRD